MNVVVSASRQRSEIARAHGVVVAGDDFDAIASMLFCTVERDIGSGQCRVDTVVGGGRPVGDADTRGHLDPAGNERLTQSVHGDPRTVAIVVGHDNPELLAAEAPDDRITSHRRSKDRAELS